MTHIKTRCKTLTEAVDLCASINKNRRTGHFVFKGGAEYSIVDISALNKIRKEKKVENIDGVYYSKESLIL